MSRSRKHSPVCGICVGYDTPARRAGNKRLRRANRVRLQVDPEALPLVPDDVDSPWNWPSDGRMRFDPARSPKLMRK